MNVTSAYFLAAALLVPVWAQKAPIGPTRPSNPTSPTMGNNPANPNNNNNNNSPNPANNPVSAPRPIYLSGKVVLQDGTAPPDPVRIERVCSGSPRPQGYTDSKGRFQFQVDSAVGIQPDASDSTFSAGGSSGFPQRTGINGQTSRLDLTGCDLRAVLPGYVSGSVSLTSHGVFDNPDVGTIVLKRVGNVDGTTISMTSLAAPKDALKAYDKGRDALRKEKPDEAERSFQKAAELYPKYAAAWFQLGLIQNAKQPEEAEKSFTQAIGADPKFIRPYIELTLIFERAKQWDKASEMTAKAIKLNGVDFPELHFYRAVAQYNLQDTDGSDKSVREAIKLDTRHLYPQAEKLLGVILMQKRDLPGAAEHLRNYLAFSPRAADADMIQKQLAQLDKEAVASK